MTDEELKRLAEMLVDTLEDMDTVKRYRLLAYAQGLAGRALVLPNTEKKETA